jgi:hypothetical protein
MVLLLEDLMLTEIDKEGEKGKRSEACEAQEGNGGSYLYHRLLILLSAVAREEHPLPSPFRAAGLQ